MRRWSLTVVAAALLSAAPLARPQDAAPAPAPSFDQFLAGIRAEALAEGIRQETLDQALGDLQPEPVVIARDRAQPEITQSLEAYVAGRLTARVTANARNMLDQHRQVLGQVESAYGVSPEIAVAVWGLESDFGRFTGTYPTIRSLATLAFDARRQLFRTELLNALTIVDTGRAPIEVLKGSWAGAMGQPQFLPSTFLSHGVDFDGDGRVDIWSSVPDVLASMANYLKSNGWTAGERWGREVTTTRAVMATIDRAVPMRTKGCRAAKEMTVARPLTAWTALGVRLPGGARLPASSLQASLVRGRNRTFLVYQNYEALLGYNCSNPYAVTIGLLADTLSAKSKSAPR